MQDGYLKFDYNIKEEDIYQTIATTQTFQTYNISLNKKGYNEDYYKRLLQKNYYLTGPCYDLEKIVRRKKEEINLCSPNMII